MDVGECWEEGLLRRVEILGCQLLTWCGSYLMLCFVLNLCFFLLSVTQSSYCTSCKCLHICGNQKNCRIIIILVTCMILLLVLYYMWLLWISCCTWNRMNTIFSLLKEPSHSSSWRTVLETPVLWVSSIEVIVPLEELSGLAALLCVVPVQWECRNAC